MAKNKKSELKQAKLFDFKNEQTMISAMKKERMSLTCAPGGENHAGMEIIGRMPVKGEGFTAKLWSIDLTGYNERLINTPTDASDPSWSSLLSN